MQVCMLVLLFLPPLFLVYGMIFLKRVQNEDDIRADSSSATGTGAGEAGAAGGSAVTGAAAGATETTRAGAAQACSTGVGANYEVESVRQNKDLAALQAALRESEEKVRAKDLEIARLLVELQKTTN